MLNFFVIMTAVKYPNQWAVIKLRVKRELIKGLLELRLAILCFFYIIIKNKVLHQLERLVVFHNNHF